MKLLLGSSGMIGRNLKELLPPMLCPTHSELDLTDREQVKKYLDYHKPEQIIHCASNDDEICLYDNLRMFVNLAESNIPMIIFSTGRNIDNRPGKVGEYVLSKYISQELALYKYSRILVLKIWGCFGKYEKESRFFTDNMLRIKRSEPIVVRENKLFSYVYVKDLAKIVNDLEIENNIYNIVGYTESLLYYAKILQKVCGEPTCPIVVEKETPSMNYVGDNTFKFNYTPLSTALKEVWNVFNNNSEQT
jgi:dTDP-4-dehydrorhamnose reductase